MAESNIESTTKTCVKLMSRLSLSLFEFHFKSRHSWHRSPIWLHIRSEFRYAAVEIDLYSLYPKIIISRF